MVDIFNDFHSHVIHRMIRLMEISVEETLTSLFNCYLWPIILDLNDLPFSPTYTKTTMDAITPYTKFQANQMQNKEVWIFFLFSTETELKIQEDVIKTS